MAKPNKNQSQPQAAAKPAANVEKPGEVPNLAAPVIDVMSATQGAASAGEGEGNQPALTPPPPAPAEEKKEPQSYKEHMRSFDSKADKAARAVRNAEEQDNQPPPDRKIPGKYRKFQKIVKE